MQHCPFSMSLGPISTRRGTPFISYWANFQPADWSLSSMLTRMPAAVRRSRRDAAASSTPSLCWAMGMTTTWVGAMTGGSTRPWLSLWVIMIAPMRRVDAPQLVWKGYCRVLSRPVNVTS